MRTVVGRQGMEAEREVAAALLRSALALADAMTMVEDMARHGWDAVPKQEKAADTVVVEGAEVLRALKTLALQVNRCAWDDVDVDGGDRS